MRNILVTLLYIIGYLIIALNVGSIPVCLYYFLLICICKFVSNYAENHIEEAVPYKRLESLKIFPAISLRGSLYVLTLALLSFVIRDSKDSCCMLLAFATTSTIFPMVVDVIKLLYVKDPRWLISSDNEIEGQDGHIGLANVISVIRIATAAILPPIFVWAGDNYKMLCFLALVLVISTDWIDGHIARLTNSVTKTGKYLDPLGDKVLFIPNCIAFLVVLANDQIITGFPLCIVAVSIILTILRDILIFIWFATMSKQYAQGVSAGMADKIRMVLISCWLIITANIVTVDFAHDISISVSIALTVIMALFSVISIIADLRRLRKL